MMMLTLVLLSLLSSFAQPRLLDPNERVKPVQLLEFEDEPGHCLFVGESSHGHHVFDVRHGLVTEVPMKGGTVGLEAKLKLASGARLVVPENHRLAARGGRAYLIYPDRAREPLARRSCDRDELNALGLGHLLEAEPPARAAGPPHVHDPLPEDGVLVLLNAKGEDEYGDTLKADLAAILETLKPGCRVIEDGNRLYAGRKLAICRPERLADFITAVEAEGTIDALVAHDGNDLFKVRPPTTRAATQILNERNAALARSLGALVYLGDHAKEWGGGFDTPDFANLAYGALLELRGVDQVIVALLTKIQEDVREINGVSWYAGPLAIAANVHAHPLYQRLIAPLKSTYADILSGLRAADHPAVTRLILIAGSGAEGAALPLLAGPVNEDPGRTFADAWLDWQLEHLRELSVVPAWRDRYGGAADGIDRWSESVHAGGVFQNLNLKASLVSPQLRIEARHDQLFFENERIDFAPTAELGQIENDRALKKKIVNFVITADQIAGRELPRLNDGLKFMRFFETLGVRSDPTKWPLLRKYWEHGELTQEEYASVQLPEYLTGGGRTTEEILGMFRNSDQDPEEYTGSLIVDNVLKTLLWPPSYVFGLQPGYRRETYLANVIDIVIILLEEADEVLSTQATYLRLLDIGLQLQKDVANTEESRSKQRELGTVIQNRLTRILGLAQNSKCEAMLSPDPFGIKERRSSP